MSRIKGPGAPGKAALMVKLALAHAPEAVVALALSGRRKQVDGRLMDPKAQALGDLFNAVRVPGVIPTLEESRKSLHILASKFDRPNPPGVTRQALTLPGAAGDLPARLYDTRPQDPKRATLLYLHGGGWVQGDLDTHDGLCGQIALEADIRVIALDYRLAPENPFPAAPDDVLAAYRALSAGAAGVDPGRLAVGGDSAGGNLTAVLMHDLAAAGLPMPRAQLLIYPAVDAAMTTRSMEALKDAFVLPRDRIEWYMDQYLTPDSDRTDPRVSPILSPHLSAQPPAHIIVAGQDPLWDDGHDHAKALDAAGVQVEVAQFPGQIHAFLSARRAIPQGGQAVTGAAKWLKRQLG